MSLKSVNYHALEMERSQEIQDDLSQRLREATTDFSRSGGLKSPILSAVATGSYDRAVSDIEGYLDFKTDYPALEARAKRYLDHCVDLVRAIEQKRNFPGLGALSLAKQQDIYDSVLDHFEELKGHLGQVEKLEREVKLTDMRSTAIFVGASINAAFLVVSVGFVVEVFNGLGASFDVVFTQMVTDLVDAAFRVIGL